MSKIFKDGALSMRQTAGGGGEPIPGPPGPSNVLTVGTVTTLAPGEQATVEITGTSPAQVVNYGIPKGQQGEGGGIPEAPADGKAYNRKGAEWSDASRSGPMLISADAASTQSLITIFADSIGGETVIEGKNRNEENASVTRWRVGMAAGVNDLTLRNSVPGSSINLNEIGDILLTPKGGQKVDTTSELYEKGLRVYSSGNPPPPPDDVYTPSNPPPPPLVQLSPTDPTVGAYLQNGSWGLGGAAPELVDTDFEKVDGYPTSFFRNNGGLSDSHFSSSGVGIHIPFGLTGSGTQMYSGNYLIDPDANLTVEWMAIDIATGVAAPERQKLYGPNNPPPTSAAVLQELASLRDEIEQLKAMMKKS